MAQKKEVRIKIDGFHALLLSGVLIAGCVEMRDYTSVRKGAFSLDIERTFGPGEKKKDYYLGYDGAAIILGDKKEEVLVKVSSPNTIEKTLDGEECWTYNDRKLKLYFRDDSVHSWEEF